MLTTNLVIAAGIIFILGLLGILILIPTERRQKIKHKKEKESTPEQKNWQEVAQRLEKHIQNLHNQIASLEKNAKLQDKQLLIEQEKFKKLQEKLLHERQWHEKEQSTIDRQTKETGNLKTDLNKIQDQLAKEHAENLKLDNQLKEIRLDVDKINNQRRLAEAENAQLKAKIETYQKEITRLRMENAQLAQKKEDTQWIAKSEYVQLEKQLKEAQKELEKLKGQLRKEIL